MEQVYAAIGKATLNGKEERRSGIDGTCRVFPGT